VRSLPIPCVKKVAGRFHSGEEMQDPASFSKSELAFPQAKLYSLLDGSTLSRQKLVNVIRY